MAAKSKSIHRIASLGKRFTSKIWTPNSSSRFLPAAFSSSASGYEKNLDEPVHSSAVPDDVVQPESDKYWAPHPKTGVFGPAAEQQQGADHPSDSGQSSVLEEKAWFRPTSLEDLDKPHHT